MRVTSVGVLMASLLRLDAAAAADLDRPHLRPAPHRGWGYAASLHPPAGPIVVAPPATVLVVPPDAAPAPLAYAPPPVPNEPPPLITALPIIGPYLVLPSDGPPPATVLDAYDHRYDYNQ